MSTPHTRASIQVVAHMDESTHTAIAVSMEPEPTFDEICYVDIRLRSDSGDTVNVSLHIDVIPLLLARLAVEYGKGIAHRAEWAAAHAA